VDAQALSKSLHILAKLRITQTAENITFTAKEELRINGGTSFSILNASGITHGTGGQWEVKAATQALEPGKSMAVVMPSFPQAQEPMAYHIQFRSVEENSGRIVADAPYRMTLADGREFYGKTDHNGMTQLVQSATPMEATLEWLPYHADLPPDAPTDAPTDEQEC